MGVAVYNRGSACLARQIQDDQRPIEFDFMDRLNSIKKYDYALPPFGPVRIGPGHNGQWIYCPKTEFGYWYTTVIEAVKSWDIIVTGYDNGEWIAIPNR